MEFIKSLFFFFAVLSTAISFDAHADVGSSDYGRNQARVIGHVQRGTVTAVREVSIDGNGSNTGAYIGGIIGAAAGYASGGRNQVATASILGALGSVLGNAVERTAETQKGYEIEVSLSNGDEIVVSQGADQNFQEGEKVRVITGADGTIRITH